METLSRLDYFESDMAVGILPRTPQPEFPEHRHDFHELVLISSGCALHYIDDTPYLADKGSVFHIGVGQVHYFDHIENLNLTNIVFAPERLQSLSLLGLLPDRLGAGKLRIRPGTLNECESLCAAISHECQRGDVCAAPMVESLFTQLVVRWWREENSLARQQSEDRTVALIYYLDQNYGNEIDFCELAERFCIPLRTLNRHLLNVTGLTPNSYLIRVRLCHAMRLLWHSELPITDIAYLCGFNDSNYFSSRFHREIGLSPKQFRLQRRLNLEASATFRGTLALEAR